MDFYYYYCSYSVALLSQNVNSHRPFASRSVSHFMCALNIPWKIDSQFHDLFCVRNFRKKRFFLKKGKKRCQQWDIKIIDSCLFIILAQRIYLNNANDNRLVTNSSPKKKIKEPNSLLCVYLWYGKMIYTSGYKKSFYFILTEGRKSHKTRLHGIHYISCNSKTTHVWVQWLAQYIACERI